MDVTCIQDPDCDESPTSNPKGFRLGKFVDNLNSSFLAGAMVAPTGESPSRGRRSYVSVLFERYVITHLTPER